MLVNLNSYNLFQFSSKQEHCHQQEYYHSCNHFYVIIIILLPVTSKTCLIIQIQGILALKNLNNG